MDAMIELGGIFPKNDPLSSVKAADVGPEIATVLGLPDGWPEPEPLPDRLPDVAQFDLELMPESFRSLVRDVTERMQVPMDFPAVTAIAALAGVTNRRVLIQPKRQDDSWIVVPNLWGGIIGSPGLMKSPVMGCMTQPIRAMEREWITAHEIEKQDYLAAQELYEIELRAWKDGCTKSFKTGTARPEKPQPPASLQPLRRLIVNDATFESLHTRLAENPAGAFVLRDELTGWLSGLERQGHEQERAFYLECWSGDSSFTIDRVTRGSIYVPHACVSLFGGIQPARLRDYLGDALRDGPSNDGLMQRFQLMVWPDIPADWKYLDRKPDKEALNQVEGIYRQIAEMDAASPVKFRFDDTAQALFEEWLTELESRLRGEELHPAMQAHLAKYRSLMPSLALLFALADGCTDVVPAGNARQAAAWCEYLESHAHRIYSGNVRTDYQAAMALSRRLAKGWKRDEGTFTVREVYRNGWHLLESPEAARGALLVLAEYGWVRDTSATSERQAGRPAETYQRNPRIGGSHANQ